MDDFLKERLVKYDQWLASGTISFSSRVVPVGESLQAQQWILPAEQVKNILSDAKSIALQKCLCRVHYSRCDKPLEVCLTLNELGEKFVAKGLARHISLSEAAEVLRKADENGLVHLSLYMPDHKIVALCSCCSCCCHDIQLMKSFNRKDLMVRSEYVAVTDIDKCIDCGDCVKRCVFDARTFTDEQMHYNADQCLGCGLCVSVCPAQATVMQPRQATS
ncbi:MAG: 4Fe-4S binding protein [Nitrospirae bacterium]|nr:4Fe-4S binding protein [Nitrospirota bacterium]